MCCIFSERKTKHFSFQRKEKKKQTSTISPYEWESCVSYITLLRSWTRLLKTCVIGLLPLTLMLSFWFVRRIPGIDVRLWKKKNYIMVVKIKRYIYKTKILSVAIVKCMSTFANFINVIILLRL